MRSPLPRLLAPATLLVLSAACFEPESVFCPQRGNAPAFVCPAGSHCAATQNICIYDSCGDGVVDPGEACDDGNKISGDGCRVDCRSDETCGNGIVDTAAGEVCDDHNTAQGDGCSADCTSTELCGNKIIDYAIGEVCDDGNTRSGDGCSADCLSSEICGNGIVDSAVGEVCDDGNTVPGDACAPDCKSGWGCGNGTVDLGEECDDGNTSDNDNCTTACKLNVCGDGYVDGALPRIEECDPGGETALCNANCTLTQCGDGLVNSSAGETCDTGAGPACDNDAGTPNPCDTVACDGRLATSGNVCTVAFCGDGYANAVRGEECDTGGETAACNANCTLARCGDGVVNSTAGEQCDQNNGDDTPVCDGNSAPAGQRCTTAYCGDGYANAARGEECDDYIATAGCDSDCTLVECGDGTVNTAAGETCDNPGGSDTAACDGNSAPAGQKCTAALCGDGYLNYAASELCDDGNFDNADDCTNVCHPGVCGDSIVKLRGSNVEDCDTGSESASCDGPGAGSNACTTAECGDGYVNTAAGEQCDVAADDAACDGPGAGAQKCTPAQCGDGYANAAAGEQCDDANTSNTDDCINTCQNNICGDGFLDLQGPVTEACDDGNTVDETQCPYGPTTDCTSCNSACSGPINLPARYCGDRTIQGSDGEVCDDGNAMACGTCSASCGTAITPSAATGWIDSVSYTRFQDGDWFTINDGIHTPITFEIEKSGGVAGGRVPIPISSGDADTVTAGKIKDAINATLDLWITASTTGGKRVYLTHDNQTALGNQPIQEGVSSGNFSINGMTGGGAGDCESGTGCSADADCSPLFACDTATHTCQAPVPMPTVSGTLPASPANENNPVVSGTSAPSITVQIYGNDTCTGAILGTGVSDAGGHFDITVTVADDSHNTFYAQATDGVSTSPCSSTFATYDEDSTPPASPTFTGSTPASPANDTNPTIEGTAEAGSLVRLYTDGSCTGAEAGNGTATGGAFGISVTVGNGTTTTFNATAEDAAGNVSACSSSSLTYVEVP